MKIYVITKGSYSSYHICTVTDDPVSADHLRKFHSDRFETAEIEEYETEKMAEDTPMYWEITITRNGKNMCKRFYSREIPPDIGKIYCEKIERYGEVFPVAYRLTLSANDKDHALKIAQDKIAEWKYRKKVEEG